MKKTPVDSWFKSRGYLHFDLPVRYKKAESVVKSPDNIKKHSFYPFISYLITSKKIKKNTKTKKLSILKKDRPVSYASHMDSHIYSYYACMLEKMYEKVIADEGISENVLAFRKLGKSNIDFANSAFEVIIKKGFCGVLAFDIAGFFDNLNHKLLKNAWSEVLGVDRLPMDHYKVFRSLTKYSKVDRDALYQAFKISKHNPKNGRSRVCAPNDFRDVVRNGKLIEVHKKDYGIPQGSPISALLSNIYMLDFDVKVRSMMDETASKYFRYCDDILCVVPLAVMTEVEDFVDKELFSLKLKINKDKTKKHEFKIVNGQQVCDKQLQYLGFTFDGRNKLIRSAALARFSERMKSGINFAKLTKDKYDKLSKNSSQKPQPLYKKKIYNKYSHLGHRNFIRYGLRSASIMSSQSIKNQLKPLWNRLQKEINKKKKWSHKA